MTVLAIGATGFVGPHVVRPLVEDGHEVAVLHRGTTNADLPDAVRHVHGDRNEPTALRGTVAQVAPTVVVDVVPYTEAQARQVVSACRDSAERLVVVSSSDVYRNYDGWRGESVHDPDPVPLAEDAPLRKTRYPYRGYDDLNFAYAHDYDKILVEQVVMNATGLASTVLRLPAVYGPGDAQGRLAPHLRRMADNRPAILLDKRQADWHWTHGYVENVGAALAAAVTDGRAAGRIYNVGETETPTTAERVRQLAEVVGWDGEVLPLPEDDLPAHLRAPFDWRYELATDTRRLRDDLDYGAPVGADEALRRTAEWVQSNDRLGPIPDYDAEDAALSRAP